MLTCFTQSFWPCQTDIVTLSSVHLKVPGLQCVIPFVVDSESKPVTQCGPPRASRIDIGSLVLT